MIIQKFKIVFAGSMGSGKTEAIKSLSEIPVIATEASLYTTKIDNSLK